MAALAKDAVIGVIGAGVMGAGIAQVAAAAGHEVLLIDAQAEAIVHARADIDKDLQVQVRKGRLSAEAATATLARITPADWDGLGRCALVIEAIAEDLEAKRTLVARLQQVVSAECIIATNTSSLSITAIAAGSTHPGRVVGMHFFNPPARMKLVEVVSGVDTSPEAARTVFATAEAWG